MTRVAHPALKQVTIFRWEAKYSEIGTSDMGRLRQLEEDPSSSNNWSPSSASITSCSGTSWQITRAYVVTA
jgi:hypothetical protein